jgi:hypothetical protein
MSGSLAVLLRAGLAGGTHDDAAGGPAGEEQA